MKGKTVTSVGNNFIIIIVGDLRGTEKLVGNGLEAQIFFEDGGVDVPEQAAAGEPGMAHWSAFTPVNLKQLKNKWKHLFHLLLTPTTTRLA